MAPEPLAVAAHCDHHYASRLLGGHPLHVRACTLCHTPDWNDLMEQALALYQWGYREGVAGRARRETLSAYDRPAETEPADAPQTQNPAPRCCGRPEGAICVHDISGAGTYPPHKCPHCDEHPAANRLDDHIATAHRDLPPCEARTETNQGGLYTCAFRIGHKDGEYGDWHASTHRDPMGRHVWKGDS